MTTPTGFDNSVPSLDFLDQLRGIGGGGDPLAIGSANSVLGNNGASGLLAPLTPQSPVKPTFGLFDETGVNGETTQTGLVNPLISGIGGAFNIYQGLKQLGQQEDALDFQKESFGKNFAASKAAFQERLRGNFGRKATLGGNKGTSEAEYVDSRSDF